MDLSRYKDLFVSEAREHLKVFSAMISGLAKSQPDENAVNELFRHAHSMKGMAATMQLTAISTLAHAVEDLLGKVRSREIPSSRPLVDLILSASDTLAQMVDMVEGDGIPPEMPDFVNRVRSFNHQTAIETPSPDNTTPAPVVSKTPETAVPKPEFATTVRIRTSLLDKLVNLTGELLTVRHRLETCAAEAGVVKMREPIRDLTMLLRHLQREVFQARMLPFATIADRFPHMVRELGRSLHKEINFEVSGESIELDRGVLELIVEPLMHLLRNAVDHGLETPEERAAAGKPARSNLQLSIIRGADHVQIDVTDDGRGMNIPLILKKAVSQGLVDNQRASSMSKDELLMLVCIPGFSTKTSVTEVSGRGVGMDVVSHAIHTIGGTLSIASNQGEGTRITMRLPISISIIQALMVGCGRLSLAVPICNIQRTIEISSHQAVEKNGTLSFDLDGTNIPLRRLSRIFRQDSQENLSGMLSVIITEANGFPTGLLVDKIIRQQELFVRPLSTPLSSLKGVAGATTSGDGQILFVLDVAACAHPGISA